MPPVQVGGESQSQTGGGREAPPGTGGVLPALTRPGSPIWVGFETLPSKVEYSWRRRPAMALALAEDRDMHKQTRWMTVLVGLVVTAGAAGAETPTSPLGFIPEQADLLLEVSDPRQLVDAIGKASALQKVLQFSAAREFLGGTSARRLVQLVAYLEREIGIPWPEMVERLAGGGAALAVKFGPNPAPAMVVFQGKDEKLLQKFLAVVTEVVSQELARQDSKATIERGQHKSIPVLRIGNEFFAAAPGTTLVISNKKEVLERALELHLSKEGKSLANLQVVAEARKILPARPLANLWINMAEVHKSPQAKALYKTPRDEGILTVFVGGYLDLFGRAPWVAAGLHAEDNGYRLTVRLPRGREGMGPDRFLFVPAQGQPGSRALLEPAGVLYSDSSYHNLAGLWEERAQLFNPKQAKEFEKQDENSGKFLSGLRLSKLLTKAGAYHRFVAVNQPKVPYPIKPKQAIPAFAFVIEMRDPTGFTQSMNTVLRGAALLSLTQVKLKMVEEKHQEIDLVGWRFDDKAPYRVDVNDIRFNFSPCFAAVGNQFMVCSTMELGRELVGILKKEASGTGSPATARTRIYAAGVADALKGIEDQLLAQTILDQALPPTEARIQVRAFIDLVRGLGDARLDATLGDKEFHYDILVGGGK